MHKRSVLFVDGPSFQRSLIVDHIHRSLHGFCAHVINGAYSIRIEDGTVTVSSGRNRVESWALVSFEEVPLPNNLGDDYNTLIEWARNQLASAPPE
jgi:hypothetical protein